MSGRYGAPRPYEVSAELAGGYSPPSSSWSSELSRAGLFDYGPPYPYDVSVTLASGYSVPAHDFAGVELTRPLWIMPSGSTIYPSGISSLEFGLASAITSQFVFANAIDSLEFGLADFAIRTRFVNPAGLSTSAIGDHAAADFFQYAFPVMPNMLGLGSAAVRNWRQEASPLGTDFSSFGLASVEREREAFLVGFESLSVGVARIADRRLFIRPLIESPFNEHGSATVFNKRTFSFAQGFSSLGIGLGSVYNLRQFCDLSYPEDHQDNPVSQLTSVTNRNKEVRPDPIFSERIGFVQYRLGPPPVQPAGIESLEVGQQFVSHRVRQVGAVGFNQLNTGVGIVYNRARDYTLAGVDSLSFGATQFAQGPQGISTPGINPLTFGTQWVSDGARRVFPAGFDTAATGLPWISRSPREVMLSGLEGSVGGRLDVSIPPTREASTAGRNSLEVGLVFVRNRNVQARPITFASEAHGLTSIDNKIKYVRPSGVSSPWGSLHLVEFSLKTVRAQGVAGVIGDHDVRVFPQLPFSQTTYLFGSDFAEVGAQFATDYTIRPDGIASLAIGPVIAREMAIVLQGIFNDEDLSNSRPEVVSYQLVLLGPTADYPAIANRGIAPSDVPAVRVSPHTIWMTAEAPQQAKINHPPGLYFDVAPLEFGASFVSNFRREVFARPADWDHNSQRVLEFIGQPAVGLFGTLFVYPEGSRFDRIGFHAADGGNKFIRPSGVDSSVFGMQEVGRPFGAQSVFASGLPSLGFGTTWVSRDPEELLASGFDSFESSVESWPNGASWVSNQYPPFVILGSDHSAFGTVFVSTDPQTLTVGAGEQSSLLTTGIDDRIRVWQRGRMVAGAGDQSSVGLSWISHLDREILASAPMSFAPTAPRVCSGIRVDGVDGESFGEVIADFTEAGKVKRVGAGDQLVTGSMFFSFRISITAGDVSGFGASIAYNSINPIGIDDLVFGSSIVAGNGGHVCGQLPRAIPMPESDFSSIGLAGVSNA